MNYKGIIIEESLNDTSILNDVKILDTKVEEVTPEHHTPWLNQWTLHTVEIPDEKAESFAEIVRKAIDTEHQSWYADYKNPQWHFIIFPKRVFKIARDDAKGYQEAKTYGMSLGIPKHQVDFSPQID